MKKKLLFIIPNLNAGGAEKSLVNLLNEINYEKYEVDLFMFSHEGLFLEFLPKEVNLLKLPDDYVDFFSNFNTSIKNMIKKRKFSLLINKLFFTLKNKTAKDISNIDQITWKYSSKSLNKLEKEYDAAIGFLEKSSIYYCVEKVKANKKIGFIHNDYDKLGLNPNIDIEFFKKLDHIVTVSEECLEVLKNRFPSEKDKMSVMYNIVSPRVIDYMSKIEKNNLYDYDKKNKEIIILSIGRLTYQKGYEIAIDACKDLIDKNYDVKWYVIGQGEEKEKLVNLIELNNLEDKFIFLGLKPNPYPYIYQADIYAQTSRYEGKSIALDEAKILRKPIVITNYSTAKDQIDDSVTGLIADMNPKSVSENIEKLINDKALRQNLCDNLSNLEFGTESEILKLYDMIE